MACPVSVHTSVSLPVANLPSGGCCYVPGWREVETLSQHLNMLIAGWLTRWRAITYFMSNYSTLVGTLSHAISSIVFIIMTWSDAVRNDEH